uniref:Reverse transcriptase Ty1/copia-type domain-containing protein n=1 Tax=Chenopodium quinoa TaxID=63459 RepID=A0A803N8D1_CHEQI
MSSIRVVLGRASSLNLEIKQLDVKTAFLHDDLEEDIYMEQQRASKSRGRKRQNVDRNVSLKQQLSKTFSMKELGPAKNILGMRIIRDRKNRRLWLSQEAYIQKVLQRFNMEKAKPMNMKLCFGSYKPILVGYLDSDMAGDIDSRKSTSGYMITFAGGAVFWQSRLQKCVALSITESEFIAATEACKELLWMKRFVRQLGFTQKRYHWIRDVLDAKFLELEKIHTDDNGSDMMTKALPRGKFETCRSIAGMETTST